MSFADWLRRTAGGIRRDGLAGARRSGFQLWKGAFRRLDWFDEGTRVYDREWDLLIVLDACRFDLMREVVDEYEYLTSLEAFHSAGSSSSEWMERNFTEEHRVAIGRTVHVTGNPNSADSVPVRDFLRFDEVWQYAWDEDLGTIHPDPLTDRAIALHREHDPERMIVHYMQPHHPFVRQPLGEGFGATDPWDLLQRGEVDRETIWAAYRENLRYVLDRLPTLLRNVDARNAVITADHGNLLGEYGFYAHPAKVAVSELRRVPWCRTTARDEGTYDPTLTPGTEAESDVVERRLEDLGYR
jgi:hypothetical protein